VQPGNSARDQRVVISHQGLFSAASIKRRVRVLKIHVLKVHASNGFCTRIVSSRSGLVESKAIGQPTNSSTSRTYLIACAGRSAHDLALAVGSFQPSTVSYIGLIRACAPSPAGK